MVKALTALSGIVASVGTALGGGDTKAGAGRKEAVCIDLDENASGPAVSATISAARFAGGIVSPDAPGAKESCRCDAVSGWPVPPKGGDFASGSVPTVVGFVIELFCATASFGVTKLDVCDEAGLPMSFDTLVFLRFVCGPDCLPWPAAKMDWDGLVGVASSDGALVDGFDVSDGFVDVASEAESEEGEPSSARAIPIPWALLTAAYTPSATASAPIRPMCIAYRNNMAPGGGGLAAAPLAKSTRNVG